MPAERGHGALLRRTGLTVADALASWPMDSGTVDGATSARSKAGIWHLGEDGRVHLHFHYAAEANGRTKPHQLPGPRDNRRRLGLRAAFVSAGAGFQSQGKLPGTMARMGR
jgi:hypothetical protein